MACRQAITWTNAGLLSMGGLSSYAFPVMGGLSSYENKKEV